MSALVLKLIAAFSMLIDHAGLILFGNETWMRAVGRLAFPLYAFFIAEGFRYTKNRLRYFLSIFLLGVGCQIVCEIFSPGEVLGVLIAFSFSLALAEIGRRARENAHFWWVFAAALVSTFVFCHFHEVDSGFLGILLPVLPTFFTEKSLRLAAFTTGLLALNLENVLADNTLQLYSLLALVPLFFYNGKRGRYKLKWFFYIFYPLHFALLWGINYFT